MLVDKALVMASDSAAIEGPTLASSTPFLKKDLWVRSIVMLVCVLSMLGSLLIILSFVCCKDLRSRGRQILVNISLMDLGVALFNLCGASVYFDKFYHVQSCSNCTSYQGPSFLFRTAPMDCISNSSHGEQYMVKDVTIMCPKSELIEYLCLSQAALSLYFTYGSILWTNALCLYLYFRIVHSGTKMAWISLYASYLFCYGMPVLLTLWLAFTGRLGYSPYESSGWCSIVLMHPITMERDIYASVFGYNLWIVITLVFVPVLSCAVHISVKNKARNTAVYRRSDKLMLALVSIDYKFILIPLAFILLRIWSFIGDILHLYIHKDHLNQDFSLFLIILAGIGDSGQGITNSLIFLFFTKKFKDAVRKVCCGFVRVSSMNIQGSDQRKTQEEGSHEDKSLLDSTSVDNISPHQFTYHSFDNTTPQSLVEEDT